MIDKNMPYGEVIAAQQAEHGKRVEMRQRVNGQPFNDIPSFDDVAAELNARLDTAHEPA